MTSLLPSLPRAGSEKRHFPNKSCEHSSDLVVTSQGASVGKETKAHSTRVIRAPYRREGPPGETIADFHGARGQ